MEKIPTSSPSTEVSAHVGERERTQHNESNLKLPLFFTQGVLPFGVLWGINGMGRVAYEKMAKNVSLGEKTFKRILQPFGSSWYAPAVGVVVAMVEFFSLHKINNIFQSNKVLKEHNQELRDDNAAMRVQLGEPSQEELQNPNGHAHYRKYTPSTAKREPRASHAEHIAADKVRAAESVSTLH